MTSTVNGATVLGPPPPEPHLVIAERVYTDNLADTDVPWAELDEEDQLCTVEYVRDILHAHVQFLSECGFRIIPPGAVPTPKTEPEAMAMLQAAKTFFDAAKRKGKLMSGAAPPKKLILPPGMH